MTDIEIPFNVRHQGSQDYPSKEIEKEDPRQMEPHRQACGTSCYAQTGDILSKEHSPTAKAVVLCVEG